MATRIHSDELFDPFNFAAKASVMLALNLPKPADRFRPYAETSRQVEALRHERRRTREAAAKAAREARETQSGSRQH